MVGTDSDTDTRADVTYWRTDTREAHLQRQRHRFTERASSVYLAFQSHIHDAMSWSQALFVRVVRKEGPQLSLIDAALDAQNRGVTCLCQVVKLARKYDPQGIRTLGVDTKCDDAARAESSDVVEKVGKICVTHESVTTSRSCRLC